MPDGTTGYPESVLFRLIDSKGGPNVKITATDDGSAMSLVGESNPTHVQVMVRGTNASLTLVNKDGKQQVIKP
jgi:PKD repeat protein